MSEYLVPQKVIEDFMQLNFIAEKKEISEVTSGKKLFVKIDGLDYFTILDNGSSFQLPIINYYGNIYKLRKVLIESGIKIKDKNQQSIKLINNFINEINKIFINDNFSEFTGDHYSKTVKTAKFDFLIKIVAVPFFDESMVITERLNFSFEVINKNCKNIYKDSLKFKIHDEYFKFSKNKININDVDINFFIKKLKMIFIDYNKLIIQEYNIDIDKKMVLQKDSDDYFEMFRDTIKMINI